ncbi:hypothetical protein KBC86_04160 [Candidatus Gracilibacteria bacterium]|nr:hypothetical protein [Candidatus Gracilibacteria bacterium]
MKEIDKNNLYLKVLEFGVSHPSGFKLKDLLEKLRLEEWEAAIVYEYARIALFNRYNNLSPRDTIFLKIDKSSAETSGLNIKSERDEIMNGLLILRHDSFLSYIDYLELQQAINNSKEANKHAKTATIIAIASICIAIITGALQINLSESTLWNIITNLF